MKFRIITKLHLDRTCAGIVTYRVQRKTILGWKEIQYFTEESRAWDLLHQIEKHYSSRVVCKIEVKDDRN